MFSILWILINISLLICVLIIFIRAIKLLNREYGKFSASILTISLLIGLFSCYNWEHEILFGEENTTHLNHLNEYFIDELKLSPIHDLSVSVAADTIEYRYECKTTSNQFYLSSIFNWKEISTNVFPCKKGYRYQIYGTRAWKLLNISVYKKLVCLQGEINRKKIKKETKM